MGLNFGEPSEIGTAKEQHEKRITEGLAGVKEGIDSQKVASVEVSGKVIKITLDSGETYSVSVREVSKGE